MVVVVTLILCLAVGLIGAARIFKDLDEQNWD
jgi:hypothetical protein